MTSSLIEFEVSDDRVFVHYVRHAAQDVVRPEHK